MRRASYYEEAGVFSGALSQVFLIVEDLWFMPKSRCWAGISIQNSHDYHVKVCRVTKMTLFARSGYPDILSVWLCLIMSSENNDRGRLLGRTSHDPVQIFYQN
jgi:hypothetical protein